MDQGMVYGVGVYTDITSICTALQRAARDCDYNSVPISFVPRTDSISKQNLDTLDSSFMYTQILKKILLTIEFEQTDTNEFLTYCREQLADNEHELRNINKIQKEYHDHQPIWWYTYQSSSIPCSIELYVPYKSIASV